MRITSPTGIAALLVMGCASAGAKKGEEPAPVYLTQEVAPTCSYKEIGLIEFTNTESSEGDELALSIKRELGRRARQRGADAVVKAGWVTKLTVVRATSGSSRGAERAVGRPERDVKGTAITFDSPDCMH